MHACRGSGQRTSPSDLELSELAVSVDDSSGQRTSPSDLECS